MSNSPINNISWVEIEKLKPAEWRTTHTLKPDLKVLAGSILDFGWTSPIVVQKDSFKIIDGFHRWVCAQSEQVKKIGNGKVPIVIVDVDEIDAMLMHVRLNRGRGDVVTKHLSNLVRSVVHSKKYSIEQIKDLLTMSNSEIAAMVDGTVIKQRKIKEHTYSRAWVPIEAPSEPEMPSLERPPNADR